MADSPADAPDWLARMFIDRGESSPELVRSGRVQVWAAGTLVAKVHPCGAVESISSEQSIAALAGTVVPAAEPKGVSEGPDSLVTWWRRVPIARPATGGEALAWLRSLHDDAPVPARQASLVLGAPLARGRAANFIDSLTEVLSEQHEAALSLSGLPGVFVHADANPTNVVVDDLERIVGLDFELAGAGPRVFDVATVGVLQEEMGMGTLEQAMAAYGEQEDVNMELLGQAATVVRANRIVVCALHPGWLAEGWDRLRAWREGRAYAFAPGAGPK